MQFVVPHETVRARVVRAVHIVCVAGDIEGRGAVEVLGWVVVYVGELKEKNVVSGWLNRRE